MAEEFKAFPKERVQQIEARKRAAEPYQSPHLPEAAKKRVAASNMQTSVVPQGHPNHMQAPQTVPVQSPGFTNPTSEPEGVALELPSRYAFYGFKDVYVKPFKGVHLGKLSRAKEESSTLHMVEAVSSVLSTSRGDTNVGFRLTLPDFYFVLYWLRMNSFTKSLFIHTATCTNEKHIERVNSGELGADTLTMSEVIRKSNLQTIMLDEAPNPEVFKLEYPGIALTPAVMQDAIELTEDPDFAAPEFRFAGQLAVYLQMVTPAGDVVPSTLRDRIRIVDDLSPDDIQVINDYEDALGDYGIKEEVRVTCKGCGTSKMDRITIDAHSFFP